MTLTITDQLASFVSDTRYEDLPQDVAHESKRIILDSVGVALGGLTTDKGRISVNLAKRLGGAPEATIIGAGHKVGVGHAAFANAELINALDYDNNLLPSHVTPYVLPAPLALSEWRPTSGKDLILANALAHEISTRLGRGLGGLRKVREDGMPVPSDVFGYGMCIFGGTGGAAKIMQLTQEQTLHALGLAGYFCPVPSSIKWFDTTPISMCKYLPGGLVSQSEIYAVLLAQSGYTGDISVLDGERGFWKFFGSEIWKPENVIDRIGQDWFMVNVNYKVYPCCGDMQAPLEAFLEIIEKNNLKPEDIQEVIVELDFVIAQWAVWTNRTIKSHVDAQFSVPWVMSVAAHRVKVGPGWQDPQVLENKDIHDFMKKVKLIPRQLSEGEKEHIRKYGNAPGAAVVQVVAGDKVFKGERFYSKGRAATKETRMTDAELIEKFRTNASTIFPDPKINQAVASIMQLEKLEEVSQLIPSITIKA